MAVLIDVQVMANHALADHTVQIFRGGSGTFSLRLGAVGAMVLSWGIQSEQLQVSYYEPYYASLWF